MGWIKRIVEQQDDDITRLSIVFTWDLPEAYQHAIWLNSLGQHVIVGGPAVKLMPTYLSGVAEIGTDLPDAINLHNPEATFTSRGCIRRCQFCAVWRTEGNLVELNDWPIRPIVCDNNLLACSKTHLDSVMDKLKPLPWTDFNQGLDARLLTAYHAARIAELNNPIVRLAFDSVKYEQQFLAAHQMLRTAGIPTKNIRVYVLINFNDTPEDALYRLQTVRNLGSLPNPMRYNPLDTLRRNSYLDPHWTEAELHRYMRYWSKLNWLGHVPFEEYHG